MVYACLIRTHARSFDGPVNDNILVTMPWPVGHSKLYGVSCQLMSISKNMGSLSEVTTLLNILSVDLRVYSLVSELQELL